MNDTYFAEPFALILHTNFKCRVAADGVTDDVSFLMMAMPATKYLSPGGCMPKPFAVPPSSAGRTQSFFHDDYDYSVAAITRRQPPMGQPLYSSPPSLANFAILRLPLLFLLKFRRHARFRHAWPCRHKATTTPYFPLHCEAL